MLLQNFDSPVNSVYDDLILHAYQLNHDAFSVCTSTHGLGGPQSFLGLSEIVKAQWKNDCVNLTLKNRDLIYNQDFTVPNIIIVDPNTLAGAFAEPNNTDITQSDYF